MNISTPECADMKLRIDFMYAYIYREKEGREKKLVLNGPKGTRSSHHAKVKQVWVWSGPAWETIKESHVCTLNSLMEEM